MGWGGVVTYSADRIGTMLQIFALAPEIVCLSVSVSNHFYSCALLLYSLHCEVHSEIVFYAKYVLKNVQNPMLTAQVVRRCVFMVRVVYVAVV